MNSISRTFYSADVELAFLSRNDLTWTSSGHNGKSNDHWPLVEAHTHSIICSRIQAPDWQSGAHRDFPALQKLSTIVPMYQIVTIAANTRYAPKFKVSLNGGWIYYPADFPMLKFRSGHFVHKKRLNLLNADLLNGVYCITRFTSCIIVSCSQLYTSNIRMNFMTKKLSLSQNERK